MKWFSPNPIVHCTQDWKIFISNKTIALNNVRGEEVMMTAVMTIDGNGVN